MKKLLIPVIVAAAMLPSCGAKGNAHDPGYTLNDVWEAYDGFNSVYLDSAKYIYKNTDIDSAAVDRDHGAAAIWCQPMYVDMAMNAMLLAAERGDTKREAVSYTHLTLPTISSV